jgi:hypothetical protein
MRLSVIVPTRNPREDYLARTLEALRGQTLDRSEWEVLLVDNGSTEPLARRFDLSWHVNSRYLHQPDPGLTPTRLLGIREARADLLVFVDDDNLLAPDYLERALQIAAERPYLGAWSGNVVPEFELEPENYLRPYLWCLCIRDVPEDKWGNTGEPSITPWGAGMCVRRKVALRYAKRVATSTHSAVLGRSDALPRGANDLDLALTSLDLELGVGLFAGLSLTHLLPAKRLTPENILKTIETGTASYHVLLESRGLGEKLVKARIDQLVALYKELRGSPFQRRVAAAQRRGQHLARTVLAKNT